ncbi:tropomyosin alpha-3 chain-like [Periophthalmus magnuspinnatus]|uniref:tropomyosin alpha-3 chain-like n=1 Tax=Periophthalmus magnuspinnatus TaxID=409849 RepID=UPI0024370745|nr:tropomyosin alpha-3 chain-like [Periophthalmus magnuspinnatus]
MWWVELRAGGVFKKRLRSRARQSRTETEFRTQVSGPRSQDPESRTCATSVNAVTAIVTNRFMMEVIKKKMSQCKEQLERAQATEARLERELHEERCRRAEVEKEVSVLSQKLQDTEDKLDSVQQRLKTSTLKVTEAERRADENKWKRKAYLNTNLQNEERLDKLELQLRETQWIAQEAQRKHSECQDKVQLVEEEVDGAEQRAQHAQMKQRILEDQLRVLEQSLKSLQASGEKFSLSTCLDENLRQLIDKVQQAEFRAENSERKRTNLKETIDQLEEFSEAERRVIKVYTI